MATQEDLARAIVARLTSTDVPARAERREAADHSSNSIAQPDAASFALSRGRGCRSYTGAAPNCYKREGKELAPFMREMMVSFYTLILETTHRSKTLDAPGGKFRALQAKFVGRLRGALRGTRRADFGAIPSRKYQSSMSGFDQRPETPRGQ